MDDKELELFLNTSDDDTSEKAKITPFDEEITLDESDDDAEVVIYDNEAEDDDDEYEEYDLDNEPDPEYERLRIKEESRKKKRRKKTHGRLAFALIMVTMVLSVAVFSALGIIYVAKEIIGIDRENTEFSIEIPENSGTEAIANILKSEGIIDNPNLFRIVSKLKGADGTYIAGEHKVNPNMSYGDIIEILQEEAINPREFVTVTFPEGIRLIDAAEKLEENGICSADEFIRAFNSTSFGFDFENEVRTSANKFYKMEGFFFPDTYEFYLEEDPKNVVKKVFKNFDYRVTPDYYGRMEDMGLTLEETITLASIVQAEAGDTYNMKYVASVFHNRLNNPDMFPLLQSDPTSNYSEEVIAPNMEIRSQSILDAYDTYVGGGLPPGPICNPGIDAIEAVLYPRESEYFYFCSDLTTGEFFYAVTLEEHEANLVKANLV